MLTSKQRAVLRGVASTEDTIFQIGKGGIPDTLVNQISDALRVREIVKVKVLENSSYDARSASEEVAEKTGSDVVQVIGSKFVVYKRNSENPVIKI